MNTFTTESTSHFQLWILVEIHLFHRFLGYKFSDIHLAIILISVLYCKLILKLN